MSFSRVPAHDPRGPYWQGYEWSEWVPLEDSDLNAPKPPHQRGVYRVHCRQQGLAYIGISDNVAARIGTLRRQVYEGVRRGHSAGRCIREAPGPAYVSWVELDPERVSRRELYGIEVELIAAYRAATHQSPHCQWSGGLRREGGPS